MNRPSPGFLAPPMGKKGGEEFAPIARLAAARRRLHWRWNRLRCMTLREVSHRIVRTLAVQGERARLHRPVRIPRPDLAASSNPWVHVLPHMDASPYVAAARRIAAGRYDVFALRDANLGSPPRWNRDPKTGIEAPLVFGKLLDYRNPKLVGDIKYLWEPNRHLHLVTLAQAYALTGDAAHFHVLRQHLESWFSACPYRMGPNWTSALEVAIRLINWSIAWQLLGGAHSPLFEGARNSRLRRRWLDSVHQHAQFVLGHFSLYSSANNHLIGEAAGLFIAALTWPHWPCAGKWLDEAKAILEREARLQIAPDGVSREQSTSYQQFVLDLLLLPLLAGKANGHWFSAAYESRIEAMLEFVASMMDAGGELPMIGDADDGRVVRLSESAAASPHRSLLASGAVLFGRGDFKRKAGRLDDKTRWLVGENADALFEGLSSGDAELPVRRAFADGGYYILGCDFESPAEIRVVADAGPLGYPAIAAHGHADALSFTLSVGGRDFLVDPGTYTYHTAGEWRRYFRGTSAHNTVCVDGTDQSQGGGNFMWLRKANAGCSLWSSTPQIDEFEGWHDGYMHLPDPVMHRRRIVLDKAARRLVIDDRLEMAGEHDVDLLFHCSEHCEAVCLPDGFSLRRDGAAVLLKLPPGGTAEVYRGSTLPPWGWVSRSFDQKVPASTIAWHARLAGSVVLRTEIAC